MYVIEKKPLTLEKDTEDHGKYYFNYPKLSVLDYEVGKS